MRFTQADKRYAYKVLIGKPERKRPQIRLKLKKKKNSMV
jgi:hypothetical protein